MMARPAIFSPGGGVGGGVGGGLFVDHKKGEIPELKSLLRDSAVDKNPKQKRAVMERVVGYMTLGIDMSPLFSEMIMATATKDLVQKKMCYLYLTNYASQQAEMALLVINTLQKDARDQDPMVRGLALRCLCSLHVENVLEYLVDPVLHGLRDVSGYVRKTAVLCVLRLRELSEDIIKDRQLVHEVFHLLSDRDAQVAANAVHALIQLQGEAGMRLLCNKTVIIRLLKRLREFSEWAQCLILQVVAEFRADSDEEMFEVMNFLDERLRNCNAAIVVATVKVLLNLSADKPNILPHVIQRTKGPLVCLMTSATDEVAYVLLKHMIVLATMAPGAYDDAYAAFFIRYSDAPFVQHLKIKMLVLTTSDTNFMLVVEELTALVSPHDSILSTAAIQALGEIGARRSKAAPLVADKMCALLRRRWGGTGGGNRTVQNECIHVARDVLRKFPPLAAILLPALTDCFDTVDTDSPAQVALVWVLGEFAATIPEAPYLLETMIDDWDTTVSPSVRGELLTAAMKAFFVRAPEMRAMLGRLLKAAVDDASNADVHDRALLYFRLLSADVDKAKAVLVGAPAHVGEFAEEVADELQQQMVDSFGSLSVVYNMPEQRWMSLAAQAKRHAIADADMARAPLERLEAAPPSAAPPPAAVTPVASSSIFSPAEGRGLDQGGGGGAVQDPLAAALAASQAMAAHTQGQIVGGHHAIAATLEMDASISISPEEFQGLWTRLPEAHTLQLALKAVPDAAFLEAAFVGNSIKVIASGAPSPALYKFFVYGVPKGEGGLPVLAETNFDASTNSVVSSFKSGNPRAVRAFAEHLRASLSPFLS